jgi:hypothetical protein
MRKVFLGLFISLAFGSLLLVSAKQPPKRITFARGQSEITLRGYLRSRPCKQPCRPGDPNYVDGLAVAEYVVRVKDNQSIEVLNQCDGDHLSVGTDVTDSSGKSGGDHDMQGNSGFANTKAGDYLISVSPSLKDNRRSGRFCIIVRIG